MVLQVLYEDNHLIAVYKPAGVLVQADETGDPTLMDEVKYYIKTKYQKPGNVFLGLIHRLDRPVSGIILFAKTSKGASRISEQFRAHTMEKVYHALVHGVPAEKEKTLVHYLKKDTDKNFVYVYDNPAEGALRAELDYTMIETKNGLSLLKIILKTGRPHQIRAQLSYIGCPIVGDAKYGMEKIDTSAPSPVHSHLCLSATSLTFTTATTEERKKVEIGVPEEWMMYLK